MQSTSFNKYKKILGILLSAAVLISSNLCTYSITNNNKIANPRNAKPDYYLCFYTDTTSNLNVERYVPRVLNVKNREVFDKLENNFKATFLDWMPEAFNYPDAPTLSVCFSSDKYLSIEITYAFIGRRTDYAEICNTFDMTTGEALYLDDIIEVDDELVSMILTEGNIKMDFDFYTGDRDVYYPKESLNRKESAWVLERLQLCSAPFDENNWAYKPTFHLEKDRLYLLNVFNENNSFYFELDTIRHKLKVDAW